MSIACVVTLELAHGRENHVSEVYVVDEKKNRDEKAAVAAAAFKKCIIQESVNQRYTLQHNHILIPMSRILQDIILYLV